MYGVFFVVVSVVEKSVDEFFLLSCAVPAAATYVLMSFDRLNRIFVFRLRMTNIFSFIAISLIYFIFKITGILLHRKLKTTRLEFEDALLLERRNQKLRKKNKDVLKQETRSCCCCG